MPSPVTAPLADGPPVPPGGTGTHVAGGAGAPSSVRTVLFLDHTAKWSGGEIALLRTLQEMDTSRVRPVVVLGEDGPFATHLRESNIETRIAPLGESAREVRKGSLTPGALLGKVGVLGDYARYVTKIAQIARETGASLIHCNSLKADIYGAFAGKKANVPVLWHVRDHIDPSYLPGPVVKVFRALASKMPAFVVCNSQSTLDTLFPPNEPKWKKRRETCAVVHDGITSNALAHTPTPVVTGRWKHEVPRVGILGRLVEWKGQHVFLQSAQAVLQTGARAEFVLIGGALFGEADYEAKLKAQAEPIGETVTFTGFQSNVHELLSHLDILIHGNITPEPFGQVVTEGLAAGLPVVATNAGGVREIVTNGENGILTLPGDADALAVALIDLLQNPMRAQELGRAGWFHVRANFTARQTAERLEAVYDKVWKNRP